MVPFLLFLACGKSLPDVAKLQQHFQEVHPLVYQIYQGNMAEVELHQLLSSVFVGRRLTGEYVEHYSTLHHMRLEETYIDVKQIDYNTIEVLDFDVGAVQLDVDWSVGGIVTHQGHKHTRVNRYQAVYTMIDTGDKGWRISDVKMRNAERVRRATDEDILNGTDAGGGYLDPMDLLDAGMFELPNEGDTTQKTGDVMNVDTEKTSEALQ